MKIPTRQFDPVRKVDTTNRNLGGRFWVFSLLAFFFLAGCAPHVEEQSSTRDTEPTDALLLLRAAVDRQDWHETSTLSRAVLLQHHDNPDAIELTARAAHGNGEADVAATLMSDACRVESFSNPTRLKHAVAALLAVGRVYDCIELLESAMLQQHDQHDIRRMLYQMCWGVEDRPRAIVHGQYLVMHRQFDVDLLLEISATEARTESSDSLVEMANRHPRDNRPLIAEARIQFDRGNFDQAAELLRNILQSHPDHAPSLALLSRVLVNSGSHDEFAELLMSAPKSVESYPFFWLAQGDWCRAHQHHDQAARAYWEATQRDPDLRESWSKLSTSLAQLSGSRTDLSAETMQAVEHRAVLLTRFSHSRASFLKTGKKSRSAAIEMASTLQDLGRLWEAEAWAAIATTLPEEQSVDVDAVRNSIIRKLRKTTPWQTTANYPALNLDLSNLPLPQISPDALADPKDRRILFSEMQNAADIRLTDEANSRGLKFFGRTGDDLDQPGIMHYQTLGCGGGTIDFDLDGWSDLYLAAAGGTPPHRDSQPNSLWRNLNGEFTQVTTPSQTGDMGFAQGIAVGDVNEDGFADLLVLNYGPNTLLINNGDGTFADASDRLGEDESKLAWSSSGAIADLDGDGLADLTILNYGAGLDPVTRECRQESTNLVRACSPLIFPGATDCFVRGTQSGQFVDTTLAWSAIPSVIGRGLGVTIGSLDTEPGLDVFIANDLTSNHYWSQSSHDDLELRESAILRGLGSDDRSPGQGSMGMATGDFDRDGDIDFYITNFVGECNTYHEQVGAGLWRDQTALQNLYAPTLPFVGFGTEAIDLDNNGILELIVANGHIDTYPGEKAAPYAQLMQIFQRQSSGGYQALAASSECDYLHTPHVGRALWTLDVNRDGLTDFAVTHQTEPVALLVNQTRDAGHCIELQLVGRDCSRDAIGATIELHSDDQRWTVPVTSGDGYLSSNERIIRIGIGESTDDCDVTVTWPDDYRQTYRSLTANASWMLVQGDEKAFPMSPANP
ncbi:FG-GAP-like repeat-containing protein [Aporhodopirellula aestuarii]|uniref:FG-GAP-like repeat-containing protein n=1 Tax=Aporhodopirellula aestuarii TaxID=2950107 RepID=A0ABT0U9A1_9BACT|nr:FG-GAP-like repeat-containing protein [Aporhodopirellula aestuarii]MCM2373105.1 FG-GAP-like repeat-containing protein [Aporhodopirellula aestuarii]